jgi:hypothetical protein
MAEEGFRRRRRRESDFYKTQVVKKEDFTKKSVPKICCHCNKIYKIDTWKVDEGKPTGVSHGFCPECYEKLKDQLLDNNSNKKEEEENG